MTENATIKCGLTMPLSDLFRRNQLQSMEEILLKATSNNCTKMQRIHVCDV